MTVNTTLPVTNSQISTHTLTWSVTDYVLAVEFVLFISTHTLTWSVTGFLLPLFLMVLISTHTLTWSVTGTKCTIIINERFQLTRSRGAWLRPAEIAPSARDFNSHAHVERDVFNPLFVCVMFDFNSHAHVERDFFVCTRSHSIFRFQLTRSRGAWLYRRGCRPVCRNFNSHAHVERDNQLRLHNKNI